MDYYSPRYTTGQGELPPDLLAKTGANLRGMLSGELPPDVQNLLAQRAAELGISSGTSGSEFNKFRSLRDLGLTSLDRMDAATKMLAPEFISPAQSVEFQKRNQGTQGNFGPLPGGGWGLNSGGGGSAPLVQPRSNPTAPTSGAGRSAMLSPGSDNNSIIAELGQKYGPGGGGAGFAMTPMGIGTTPYYGVEAPLGSGFPSTGGGSMFMGDPSQLSTEEQWQYGMVPGLTPEEQASYAVNPFNDMGTFTGDSNLPEEDFLSAYAG